MDTPEDERTKLISCLGAFRQFWGTLPQVLTTHARRWWFGQIFVFWWRHMFSQESHEQCVQWIVRFIHSQHSPKRIAFLYDCLAMAVETSLLTPRFTTLINTCSDFSAICYSQKSTWLLIMCSEGLCVEHSLVLKVWSGRELSCGHWPSNWFGRLSEGLTTRYFSEAHSFCICLY